MNDLQASVATTLDSAMPAEQPVVASAPAAVEFVGSSDHTIAEAVRRALSRASISLRTLDGAGVVVIPQIARNRSGRPRFNVTLRVSPSVAPAASLTAQR